MNVVPNPKTGDYEIFVKIKVCGFCNGTDIRIIDEDVTDHQYLKPYPTVLGHEAAGTVIETGKKAHAFLNPMVEYVLLEY